MTSPCYPTPPDDVRQRRVVLGVAQLVKIYGNTGNQDNEQRYSPAVCTGTEIKIIAGDLDPKHISTSYVERKKAHDADGDAPVHAVVERIFKEGREYAHTVSLHFMYYNFCRNHQSLRTKKTDGTYAQRTPAKAAGVAKYQWSLSQLAGLLD